MKRSNEFAVGLAVLAALALVVAGALWLSETDINKKQTSAIARFRTVGGLGVGAPVTLRGCRWVLRHGPLWHNAPDGCYVLPFRARSR